GVPRNDIEIKLAEIWSEVLGIDQPGVHDNFFELGGDSILSLQITAKANRAGLRITPKQIFDYPTIAQLASCAGLGREQDEGRHERAPGEQVPLTPIQHWFFERQLIDPHHFKQAVMFCAPTACSRVLLA